jgi:hypothetical protein
MSGISQRPDLVLAWAEHVQRFALVQRDDGRAIAFILTGYATGVTAQVAEGSAEEIARLDLRGMRIAFVIQGATTFDVAEAACVRFGERWLRGVPFDQCATREHKARRAES